MSYSISQFKIDFLEIKIETNNKLLSILATSQILDYVTLHTERDQSLKNFFGTLDEGLSSHKDIKPTNYFHGMLLVNYISCLEYFFVELIRVVLKLHPNKVGKDITLSLNEIFQRSKDEMIELALDKYINKLMYKKPKEYLKDLCAVLTIDPDPLEASWSIFIEAKSRRDLGIHNNWAVNELYISKNKEAGNEVEYSLGELAFPDGEYTMNLFNSLKELIDIITGQVEGKYLAD